MKPVTIIRSLAMPLLRDNIDTDAIIPSREIRSVGKTGLADGLFAGWRYTDPDKRIADPGFVLNDARYANAGILLAGGNFGCGSSREHAAWALAEYGFKAIVAASFNPIFYGNCVRNGMVPVQLDARQIWEEISPRSDELTVDLARQSLSTASGKNWTFSIDAESREMLLRGLDAIELTLQRADRIEQFRQRDRLSRPWIYLSSNENRQ